MLIWDRPITADDIDTWLTALRQSEGWTSTLEPIARTTLLAMAASETTHAGRDLYQVCYSPLHREQFVAAERDDTSLNGRAVTTLMAVDERMYARLARCTLATHSA
jgi:hypothetical protein